MRNVRIAAMAATRPMSSQLGVMVVCTISAASWNVSPATSQRAKPSQTTALLCVARALLQHDAKDTARGFQPADRDDEERQRLQHEREVVRGKVQRLLHDL